MRGYLATDRPPKITHRPWSASHVPSTPRPWVTCIQPLLQVAMHDQQPREPRPLHVHVSWSASHWLIAPAVCLSRHRPHLPALACTYRLYRACLQPTCTRRLQLTYKPRPMAVPSQVACPTTQVGSLSPVPA